MRYLLFLLIGSRLFATCSGSSPTWTAASAASAEVSACITAASNGDTINVPSGNVTWTSTVTVNKDLSIIGAGKTATLVTGSINCFILDMSKTTRISGFGFTNCTIISGSEPVSGKTFRIDHNDFTSTSWQENAFNGSCQTPIIHPTGLVDNNSIKNYRFVASATNCLRTEGTYQDQAWAQTPPSGSGTAAIYIEDNTLTWDNGQNFIDGNSGARVTARFNTFSGGQLNPFEIHSVQGNNRAFQWWEFYKNTHNGSPNGFTWAFLRGGSGVLWGNRISATSTIGTEILMNNVRSCRDPGGGPGKCDGTSNWDQNSGGGSGYACRDQIGRSKDNALWSPGQAYAQDLTPAYFWDNIKGTSTQMSVAVDAGEACEGTDLNSTHLVENRDWYRENLSFSGTTGVGVGVLSSRPSTCTTGVGYWATDQGEWNSLQGGADGQLYKCTSTNTWTLNYIPYTYPHPLQGGGGSTAPTVTTTAASSIAATTASSGGNVTADGGASVTSRGVCRSTFVNPTTSDTCTSNGTGTGVFTSSLTGLSASTLYHIRAFATNSVGTSYGSDLTFTTSSTTTPTSSISGKTTIGGKTVIK